MSIHILTIPLKRPPMTANDQRRAHWTKVRNAKTVVELHVKNAARQQKLPKIARCSIRIVWFQETARRTDSDALGPFMKAALDALTRGGWLTDDSWHYVTETSMAIDIDRRNPRIEIQLSEVTA